MPTTSGRAGVLQWKTVGAAVLLLGGLSHTHDAHAGGFTPWGTGTGDKTIALSPYFYVGPDGTTTLAPYVFFGATDYFDVMVGYGFGLDPQEANPALPGRIEIMPRAIINSQAIFALHALYQPGADNAVLGVEFHGVAAAKHFAFTYNTGWWPSIGGDDGFNAGQWFAILAPEFLVNERFSVFTEFNPNVTIDGAVFGATVVPGLTFYTDDALKHSFTVSATIPVAPQSAGPTFGLLYWTSFDTAKKGAAAHRQVSQPDAFASLE